MMTKFSPRRLTLSACLVAASLACTTAALAQSASDAKKPADARAQVVKEVEFNWKRAKKWTLDYIDAMPADALDFKPTPEIRSFAEQMLHLAYWNHGLTESLSGKANPHGKTQDEIEKKAELKTKAGLRKAVEESYDVVLGTLAGMDEAKMLEQVTFFKSKVTRLMVYSIALDHQTHHRGQTTIYLRLKGVTPPPEQ
jgi:uncharacterized damage-inducible protein DinB